MKLGVIFDGQGSNVAGLGKELYENYDLAKKIYDEASKYTDFDLKKIAFYPNNYIKRTRYIQPTLFIYEYTLWSIIQNSIPKPICAAGLSLGELTAVAISKMTNFPDIINFIINRSIFMEECCENHPSTMIAVFTKKPNNIKKYIDEVTSILPTSNIQVANHNTFNEYVLGGDIVSIEKLKEVITNKKEDIAIPLDVDGAFHTFLMNSASEKLKKIDILFNDPLFPVIDNHNSHLLNKDNALKLLVNQVSNSTDFCDNLLKIKKMNVDTIIEIGPTKVLNKMVKRVLPDVTCFSIRGVKDINDIKEVFLYE